MELHIQIKLLLTSRIVVWDASGENACRLQPEQSLWLMISKGHLCLALQVAIQIFSASLSIIVIDTLTTQQATIYGF